MATKSEKQWDEESYARTLSEAVAIKKDSKKMKMAQSGAKRLQKEKMAEAKAMKTIAKTTIRRPARKK